jgi:hypothetical protein
MDPRSIDPTACWVRHIRRGVATDATAQPIASGYLVRDDVLRGTDGLNGRQGWQAAETTAVLSDDGSFTLTLPNAAGDDGVLHRRRFRCLTDDAYEPGEEWLEFWTDADKARPLFVGTPTDFTKSKSTVTIKGADLPVVLDGAFSSDVDVWDAAAPADVIRHYSRVPVVAYGADNIGTQLAPTGTWARLGPEIDPTIAVAADCWVAAVRMRVTAQPIAASSVDIEVRDASNAKIAEIDLNVSDGTVTFNPAPERLAAGKRVGLVTPGVVELRVVARYDHMFAFVNGELVAEFRRPAPFAVPSRFSSWIINTAATLDAWHVETLAPYAARGASAVIDRQIGGTPPATGLRAQYWNAAPNYAQSATRDGRLARLWPLLGEADPGTDRVEPTLAYTSGAPPGMPGAYAARWSGAIYLDLAASDRDVRVRGLVGNARLYVGRTLRGDEGATSWAAPRARRRSPSPACARGSGRPSPAGSDRRRAGARHRRARDHARRPRRRRRVGDRPYVAPVADRRLQRPRPPDAAPAGHRRRRPRLRPAMARRVPLARVRRVPRPDHRADARRPADRGHRRRRRRRDRRPGRGRLPRRRRRHPRRRRGHGRPRRRRAAHRPGRRLRPRDLPPVPAAVLRVAVGDQRGAAARRPRRQPPRATRVAERAGRRPPVRAARPRRHLPADRRARAARLAARRRRPPEPRQRRRRRPVDPPDDGRHVAPRPRRPRRPDRRLPAAPAVRPRRHAAALPRDLRAAPQLPGQPRRRHRLARLDVDLLRPRRVQPRAAADRTSTTSSVSSPSCAT